MQPNAKTRFDYLAAHAEVAAPAVQALPESVLSIYRELRDAPEYEGLAQGQNLDVPMPAALLPLFEREPSENLALAAQALSSFGHWGGAGSVVDSGKPDKRGATWKFANLADQVLRKRLRLSNRSTVKSIGYSFEVHEGTLRLCASTPECWNWQVLGPATEQFMPKAEEWRSTLPGCPASRYLRSSEAWQRFENGACAALRSRPEALSAQLSPTWRALLDAGVNYTRPEGKCSDDCPECGKSRLFRDPASNHELHCSHYPMESRIDAAFSHFATFGLTPAQREAALAAVLATPSTHAEVLAALKR